MVLTEYREDMLIVILPEGIVYGTAQEIKNVVDKEVETNRPKTLIFDFAKVKTTDNKVVINLIFRYRNKARKILLVNIPSYLNPYLSGVKRILNFQ